MRASGTNNGRIAGLVLLVLTFAASAIAESTAPKPLEWRQVVPGIFRTQASPFAHAIVDGDRCLLIGAPYDVSPATLPPSVRNCELVLLTHHHRDTSANAAAFIARNVPVRAPRLSEAYLKPEGVAAYWQKSMPVVTPGRFPPLTERFWGDWTYLVHPVGIDGVRCDLGDHEAISWHGWTITTLLTPGHSRDHMSFLAVAEASPRADAERICFAGDAIASSGRMWSPYTLEWHHQKDEGAVAAGVSLRAIANAKPTLVLPEHGEPLRGDEVPAALLDTADRLLQLGAAKSFDAFTKSLGDVPTYRFLAPEQVGTANAQGNPIPWSKLSPHLFLSGNTYALASKEGPVLLMDPYSQNIVDRVAELKGDHSIGPLEVAMISHAHNDHYTGIFALPERTSYQVWTLDRVANVVDAPHRYLAPYVDARIPKVNRSLQDGEVVSWHEYELKIHHLPGQTSFAMGVEVQIDGKRCLFTGDNFFHHDLYSGSGGWSGRNRGLPAGYVKSVEKIQTMQPDWILAEHGGAFEFHPEDFRRRREFAVRAGSLADQISPHGDHRLDWNPQRVRVEPLICPAPAGTKVRIKLVADNPLKTTASYRICSARPEFSSSKRWMLIAAGESTTSIDIELEVPQSAPAGRIVVPLIVEVDGGIDPSDTFVVLDVPESR